MVREPRGYGGENAINSGIDPIFQGVGQMPGLEIWRIESMKVVPVEKLSYGKFYTGDSYIILHTEKLKSRIEWHIHFWLGAETSMGLFQDEAGCAAIKTCELDDSLGGGPIQHREVQGYESNRFQSLFKQGIQYLEGGVDSGFVKVSQLEFRKKLYHIKGRRKIRITQTEVSIDSLNEGDVFVLECKDTVWVWVGKDCSRLEKIKGMEFARKIKDDEKGGRATLILAEDRVLRVKFYKEMNAEDPNNVNIKTAEEGGEDEVVEQSRQDITLYRVCDETGDVLITEVGRTPLKYELLDTNDAFILDMGPSGVYAWIGKGATHQERTQAFQHAERFLCDKGYPAWTPVCRVVEEAEDNLFRNCFSNWPRDPSTVAMPTFVSNAIPKKQKEVSVDLSGLYKQKRKQELLADDIKDDGTGRVKIWRVEKFALEEIPQTYYGTFWDGDSYVLLYTYIQAGKSHESFIVYFWLGSQSTQDEKGAAALHATKVDSEVGWSSQTIRVVQGKEPLHFLRMFNRRITIMRGGIESGFNSIMGERSVFDSVIEYESNGTGKPKARLFHVKCVDEYVKNIEVDGCDAEERYTAKLLTEKLDREELVGGTTLGIKTEEVEEGSEPEEFWQVLGGKTEYASGTELESLVNERPPRLFQMSNASGTFSVEEIYNFNQDDLVEEDTMLLDIGNTLFVWVGKGANEIEKKQSLLAAKEYIKNDPSGRKESEVNMFTVKQGMEPPSFTGHFQAWDSRKWSDGKTYSELESQFGGIKSVDEELEKYSKKYPYEVLVKRIVPEGVDVVNKERYLCEKDFTDIFKMTLAQYDALPKWKQIRAKKEVKLF